MDRGNEESKSTKVEILLKAGAETYFCAGEW